MGHGKFHCSQSWPQGSSLTDSLGGSCSDKGVAFFQNLKKSFAHNFNEIDSGWGGGYQESSGAGP